jgi:hypothetical protein
LRRKSVGRIAASFSLLATRLRRTDSPCGDDERRHPVGHKDNMNLHEVGAARRPKLSLSFATGRQAKPQQCASQILPHHELRRLVADMVD